MFDEQLAGYLQLFSFPLILFGAVLWAIDLADPRITCRLVARIGIRLDKMQTKPAVLLELFCLGLKTATTQTRGIIATVVAAMLLLTLLISNSVSTLQFAVLILGAFVASGLLLVIAYLLARLGMRIAAEYSLPALGLVFVAAGVIAEFYQFLVQLGASIKTESAVVPFCTDCGVLTFDSLHGQALLVVIFYFAVTIASISLGTALSRNVR